jgi:hypothetical protein
MEKGAPKDMEDQQQLTQNELEVNLVIQAMSRYPTFVALQQEICYVFRRLCYQQVDLEKENIAEKNQVLIAKMNGIELIAKLMKEFPLIAGVQMEAAAALINLALNDENKVKIAQHDGIQLVTTAMRNHSDNMSILKKNTGSSSYRVAIESPTESRGK